MVDAHQRNVQRGPIRPPIPHWVTVRQWSQLRQTIKAPLIATNTSMCWASMHSTHLAPDGNVDPNRIFSIPRPRSLDKLLLNPISLPQATRNVCLVLTQRVLDWLGFWAVLSKHLQCGLQTQDTGSGLGKASVWAKLPRPCGTRGPVGCLVIKWLPALLLPPRVWPTLANKTKFGQSNLGQIPILLANGSSTVKSNSDGGPGLLASPTLTPRYPYREHFF